MVKEKAIASEVLVEKKTKKKKASACDDEDAEVEKKRLKKEKKAAKDVQCETDASEKKQKKNKVTAALDHFDDEAAALAKAEKKRLKKERKAELSHVEEAPPQDDAEAKAEKKRRKQEKAAAKLAEVAEESEDELIIHNGKQPNKEEVGIEKVQLTSDVTPSPETSFTVFVGGLPSHVDEAYIRRDFSECGKITNIILARWPEDGSSKGIAFITFASESAMKTCITWNGEYYENKPLRIERKEGLDKPKKVDMGKGGQRGHKPDNCMSVAVLDMSKQTIEDDLWTFFENCGTITSVKILKHRQTYESRGIAFVTFDDTSGTDKAVKLNGKLVSGKSVRVEYAAPKNDVGGGKGSGKTAGADTRPEGCSSVVVSNLSPATSEDDLWNLVRDCKSANNVSILIDKLTWASKGIAFIDFDEPADTDIAVKLSGTELGGKALSIRYKV